MIFIGSAIPLETIGAIQRNERRCWKVWAYQDDWVIEGVQFKWADAALIRADRILVLDLPRWRNWLRILRRFIGRHRSGLPDTRGSLKALRQEFQWSKDYYGHERKMLFTKLAEWREKVIVTHDSDTALSALDFTRES